jgi:hypothetical protein
MTPLIVRFTILRVIERTGEHGNCSAVEEGGAMSTITGTVRNGQVVFDEPTGLPDGCRVLVEPIPKLETFGIRESDWRDTPEVVAEWLTWYDSLEPLEMTPEEEADWLAARRQRKECEKATFDEQAEQLRRMWE